MCHKVFKIGLLSAVGILVAGHLLFGGQVFSYLRSSAKGVRSAVNDSVPVDFQLRRARDLVNDIVPEIQANVRAIAQQEVEIESLKADIEASEKALADERVKIAKLRDALSKEQASYVFGRHAYTRQQIKEDLARRFDTSKEAQIVLSGKQRLLENREKSLTAAIQMLERARSQKTMLESQIATLDGQHKLIQSASVGSSVSIDNSKLAQSQKLIDEIKKQLDVAERVLSHQARFVEPIELDTVSEKDLVTQVDAYLQENDAVVVK